ncbi:MAG: twin-arginine translocase TatA/TatE family subunit [Marinilabiliales bacterium]|nr:MAG: twin-arginine translocase TatA/TatE family subunit [Marinilabiliales bacterium]
MILFISGSEIFIILLAVVVLFGSKKIPEIARGLGKGMREFRKATDEIKDEINKASGGVGEEFKDIKKEAKEISKDLKI